ncbi:MAG TPA: NAD(P)/FAD-dependent oxidoreductase [Candidatus Thermoplasmatota archaeon]|nr:NAD(P)/FAD-dependent oxidoreductase [Candidatus Thermoplasmatota archaeon]
MTDAATVDALVVGAGPAGSNTARLLARDGHRVLLLEDDEVVGEPMQCAGLVTPRLSKIVAFPQDDVVVNRIRGALIYSPAGRVLELDAGEPHAVLMDRCEFDRRVARTATEAGAELWTSAKWMSARRDNGGFESDVLVRRDGKEDTVRIRSRLLIGADGVQTNVGRAFGIPRPREFLPGYEAEIEGMKLPRSDTIPVFASQELAPGFFSWIIPVTNSTGRAGLCMRLRRESALEHFHRFRAHPQVAPYFTPESRVTRPIVGTVPLGLPERFTDDGILLVGDACAMPKPTSGGGIYTGLVGSVFAAETASEALRRGDTKRRFLRRYERRFMRSRVGREIRIGWRLRRAFLHLRESEIEDAFRLLASRRATAVLDRFGDIDHPSHLLAPLFLAEPRLLKFLPKALRGAFR